MGHKKVISQNKLCKLIFQRPTVRWKLFSSHFISAVMTAHASNITEYGRVAISNTFTLCSGITQYASSNYFNLTDYQCGGPNKN